jgi:nucleotide-binding universal stress UspA family protein
MDKLNFKDVRKILIPTDGSEYSMHAAEYAIGIAKMLDAQITVLYVVDEIVLDQISKVAAHETIARDLEEDGQRFINYIVGLADKEGVQSTPLVVKGTPFEQIVHLAKGLNIDLIVMGTCGRRCAERILIGSVAERVIEYAYCPVIVVK